MATFVNFTNHASAIWGEAQKRAAWKYGEIVDVAFPDVDPFCGEAQILSMAEEYAEKIVALEPAALLCQGEFSLCFQVVQLLLKRDIVVLCACSRREVEERTLGNGTVEKVVVFNFVRFRKYEMGEG